MKDFRAPDVVREEKRRKANGRALSAARLGLREAERQLRACGRGREADAAQSALKRSERLEQDNGR